MSRRRIKLRQPRSQNTQAQPLNHAEVVAKGIALGLRAFCVSWPTETILRKIKEIENA